MVRKKNSAARRFSAPKSASTPKNAGAARKRQSAEINDNVDDVELEQGLEEDEENAEEERQRVSDSGEESPPAKRGRGRPRKSVTQSRGSTSQSRNSGSQRAPTAANNTTRNGSNLNQRRKKPVAKVLIEIRYFQQTTHLLIPKLPFSRVVREIAQELVPGMRFQSLSLKCLQEAAEAFVVRFFEDATLCTLHARRKTLMVNDMHLVRRLVLER